MGQIIGRRFDIITCMKNSKELYIGHKKEEIYNKSQIDRKQEEFGNCKKV